MPGEQAPLALSVVAPVFDEADGIEAFAEEVCAALAALALSHEVICVDDGSRDGTAGRLRELSRRFPALRAVGLGTHQGQSAALAAGMRLARGRVVVLMDADLQYDPADIGPLLSHLEGPPAWDCVVGVRAVRRDAWLRRVCSRGANWLAARITGDPVRDTGSGLKLCRSEVLGRVPFFRGAHRFLPTLVRLSGGKVLNRPVNHRPRRCGRSKYGSGLGRAFLTLRDALGVRWLKDRAISLEVQEL